MKQSLTVPPLSAPERLDKFLLRQFPDSGRRYWRECLEATVRINGKKAAKGLMLAGGERLELSELPPAAGADIAANPQIPLKILFEDDELLAVEKPAGLPCHPLRSGESETLVQAMLARFPKQGTLQPTREAGLVYRLDNDTSGVVLFARNAETLAALRQMSRSGGMSKIYLAMVEGSLSHGGEIRFPIAHHPKNRKKMLAITPELEVRGIPARAAETAFEPLKEIDGKTLLRVEIKVGQRHQIRAHLAALGHPIVGDVLYGAPARPDLGRHLLHAAEIRFRHPALGKSIVISSPISQEFGVCLF